MEAVLLTTIIEGASRKSVSGLAHFISGSTVTFLCNVFIVLFTLSLSMLAGSWRRFAQAAITIVWLILGLVNAIVLRYRMTPFSAEDFSMIPSLLRIANHYLTVGTLFLLVGLVAALIGAIVLLWKKLPKDRTKRRWPALAVRTALIAFGCYMFLGMGMQTQALSTDFMNLADAYEEYGFAYCFSNSLVDVGIDKPEEYGPELMQNIADGIEAGAEKSAQPLFAINDDSAAPAASVQVERPVRTQSADVPEEVSEVVTEAAQSTEAQTVIRPNIIMIQLESFFDPAYLKHFTCSENPIPNFCAIKDKYASGFLTVPVVGAGTANTEFEILTGMSTDYFGAGEYPYNTVVKDTVVEAIPQILQQYGYTSTAIHNNTGTFYNRNLVFANMGFDRFIPEEYMYDLGETPTGWHKDGGLTQVMIDTLQESDTPDFIYTITVQSHGRYPSSQVLDNPEITVTADDETTSTWAVEYYVNMIHEVDEMIGDLTAQLEKLGEPTVLVMYGDHLPALGFDAEDLSQPSLYTTEYVIWDNFNLGMKDKDIQAESLGTAILQEFDLDHGIMPAFHQAYDGKDAYSQYLETMEYDMLYGDGYLYKDFGVSYKPSAMVIGYKPICVTGFEVKNDGLYIYGENFNISSKVITDEKVRDTEYIDHQTLMISQIPKTIGKLQVGQFDENLKQLGRSTNTLYGVIRQEKETELK